MASLYIDSCVTSLFGFELWLAAGMGNRWGLDNEQEILGSGRLLRGNHKTLGKSRVRFWRAMGEPEPLAI